MITHVAVNTDALAHNVREALRLVRPQSKLMAVVKANAYGHGLVEAARVFVEAGANWLGVSTVEEGAALRQAGLDAPLLVFMPPLPEEYEEIVRQRLTATVVATAQVRGLGEMAQKLGQSVYCHAYADTGLGRLGADDSLPDVLDAATVYPSLHVTGAYTHVGPPGSGRLLGEIDDLRAGASTKTFAGLARDAILHAGGPAPMIHVAASALFIEQPESHLDMVRLGTILYGQYPDHVRERPLNLREDTFSLRSRIIALQTLEPGGRVGYGGEFICRRETRVATVPAGLAHGIGMGPQAAGGRLKSAVKAWLIGREGRQGQSTHAPQAQIAGGAEYERPHRPHPAQGRIAADDTAIRPLRAPLIGRTSMDQCCLDVTEVPGVEIGNAVTLPARRLAVDSGVPRVYVRDQGDER
jgi:alanine racemase